MFSLSNFTKSCPRIERVTLLVVTKRKREKRLTLSQKDKEKKLLPNTPSIQNCSACIFLAEIPNCSAHLQPHACLDESDPGFESPLDSA